MCVCVCMQCLYSAYYDCVCKYNYVLYVWVPIATHIIFQLSSCVCYRSPSFPSLLISLPFLPPIHNTGQALLHLYIYHTPHCMKNHLPPAAHRLAFPMHPLTKSDFLELCQTFFLYCILIMAVQTMIYFSETSSALLLIL